MVEDPEDPGESVEDLYEHAPCGFLSTDPDGTIIRVNETLLGWLGYGRADLVGKRTFRSLLSVGGQVYYETHYDPLLRMQGTVREIAVDLVRRDGSRLPALVNSDVRPAGPGLPGVVRTTVFGATFRRRYETELLAARRAAESSQQRLALIQECVSDFAVAVTRADVVEVIVSRGPALARADTCAVWLRSPDGTVLEWAGGTTRPAEPRTSLQGSAPHARAALASAPVVTAAGSLYVQLLAADEVLGVAAFGYPDAGPPDDDVRQLLGTVGRQAGQTLQRAALYEAETMLRARAQTLQLMTAALAVPLAAEQIADAAVARIVASLDFERVLFVLPGPTVAAAAGFEPGDVDAWRRDPARLAAVLDAPDPVLTLPGLGVTAVLPLRAGTATVGGLVLGRREPAGFTPGERDFLRTLATQCAQALERAALNAEAARRQREVMFLVGLGRRLDETPGLHRRATELAGALVPAVAERARVEFVTDGRLERLAGDPAPGIVAQHVAAALASGVPAEDGDEVALPLRARGQSIGVLVLGRPIGGLADTSTRFRFELAESAGLALENGRLYDQERRNAHILQRALLAGDAPFDPRAAITTWYRPADDDLEVGGDWHDAFLVGPDALAIVVGDVVGRGIRAAATMGHLRSAVRALAASDPGPAALLTRLDRFVDRFEDGRMSTVAYGVLDLATGRLRYACAGHLPPLLIEPDGRSHFLWDGRSAPVAAYTAMKPRGEGQVDLVPGARLLLYTDGLVERRRGNLHNDLDRLAGEAANRSREPLGWLLPDLGDALADGQPREDDVCLLCVGFGTETRFARTVRADVVRLRSLRDDLRAWLAAVDLTPPDRDALLLACSEAVANAIEHAYGNDGRSLVEVAATVTGDTVELTVRDGGGWRAKERERDERGRGLTVIETLMDEVSVRRDGGTLVTMRRHRTEDPP